MMDAKHRVIYDVAIELKSAEEKFGPMLSAHEGFAILLEEVDELKAEVFKNQKYRSMDNMRKEALQVAAMALRFAHDICDKNITR